jgi:putative transposase
MQHESGKRRRSIRLKGYDYSQPGGYFVTICTHGKKCSFGDVIDGKMVLSTTGLIAEGCWKEIPEHFSGVVLDAFVFMPNHIHGIIMIRRDTTCRVSTTERFGKPVAHSLPTIIRSYKAAVTKRVNELRRAQGLSVWQSNYYEHIIRNEEDLNDIREYIVNNPLKWDLDKENPANS